jgi:hypothetical protein
MKAIYVVPILVLCVVLISHMVTNANQMMKAPPEVVAVGNRLHQAMSRSSVLAEQHTNPIIALSEVCYAKAYQRALTTLMTDGEVQNAFSIDIRRIACDLDRIEKSIHDKLRSEMPGIIPDTTVAVGYVP